MKEQDFNEAMNNARQQIRNEINGRGLAFYVPLAKSKNGLLCCPACGSGRGPKRTGAFSIRNGVHTCFANGCFDHQRRNGTTAQGSDTVGALRVIWSCSETELFEQCGYNLQEIAREISAGGKWSGAQTMKARTKAPEPAAAPEPENTIEHDYTAFLDKSRADLQADEEAKGYLMARGFGPESWERFRLGVATFRDKAEGGQTVKRVIIPYNKNNNYYTARRIDGGDRMKYRKPKAEEAGPERLYNAAAIKGDNVIFVVEGPFDALAVMSCGKGIKAVALCTTGAPAAFQREVLARQGENNCTFVVALDNDEKGKEGAEKLADFLKTNGFRYITADITGIYKDAGERLQADREGLQNAVNHAIESAKAAPDPEPEQEPEEEADPPADPEPEEEGPRPVSIWDYLAEFSAVDPEAEHADDIKTGFNFFDDPDGDFAGGLKKGTMYIIGASSSAGKTTFCVQLAEQTAKQGAPVLYFSMEQTAQELTAKIISRYTFMGNGAAFAKNNKGRAYNVASTTAEVLAKHKYKDYPAEKLEAIKAAAETAGRVLCDNLQIIGGKWYGTGEKRRALTPKAIKATIQKHIAITGGSPVVFIDYMQLLEADGNQKDAIKQLDEVVADLVQIAKDLNIALVCISSYNREANKGSAAGAADTTAFRGSGMIEYSADVLFQLSATWDRYLYFDKGNKTENREPGYYLKPEARAAVGNLYRSDNEIKTFEDLQKMYRKRWNDATGQFSDIAGGLAPFEALQIDFKCSKNRNNRKSINTLFFVPAYNVFIEGNYTDYTTGGKSPADNATRSIKLLNGGFEDASEQNVFVPDPEPEQNEQYNFV